MTLKIIFVLFLGLNLIIADTKKTWQDERDYPCWSSRYKWHLPGLKRAPFHSVESCLRYCVSLGYCFVVDYDVSTYPPCWVPPPEAKLDLKKMKSHPTCMNYLLDLACLEPTIAPYSIDLCWSQREYYSYAGLEAVRHIKSIGGCLNHCAANPKCNIVDFDPPSSDSTCWNEVTGKINAKLFVPSKTATNYVLNRECLSLFDEPFVYNTDLCWKKVEGMAYKGTEPRKYWELEECLEHCRDIDCQMVDFNMKEQKPCRVKTSKEAINNGNFYKLETNNNYVFDENCFNYSVE